MLLNVLGTCEKSFDSKRLALVEGHASMIGLTNIYRFVEMRDELVKYCKSLKEFENSPFEPATLDNAHEAYYDLGTSMQVFTSQCDADFDARDVVDFDKLREIIDDLFRCAVCLKDRYELKPFQLLARSIRDLILQLVRLNKPASSFEEVTLPMSSIIPNTDTGTEAIPAITFKMLDRQKYFTDEETQSLREAEIRRQEEQQKAKEAAELGKKFQQFMIMLSKVSFEGDIEKARRYLSCLTQEEILKGYKTLDGIVFDNARFTAQLGARFQTIGDLEFQLKDNGTAEGMRCAGKLMSRISGNIVTIKSLDTSVNYSDPDNTTDPKKDEWVIMIVSHHEA